MILIRSPSLERNVSRLDLKIYNTFCVCPIKYRTCSMSLYNYRNNAAFRPQIMFILICMFGRKRQLSNGLNCIRGRKLDHIENNAFVDTVHFPRMTSATTNMIWWHVASSWTSLRKQRRSHRGIKITAIKTGRYVRNVYSRKTIDHSHSRHDDD